MVDITKENGVYKPTYNYGAPPCTRQNLEILVETEERRRTDRATMSRIKISSVDRPQRKAPDFAHTVTIQLFHCQQVHHKCKLIKTGVDPGTLESLMLACRAVFSLVRFSRFVVQIPSIPSSTYLP